MPESENNQNTVAFPETLNLNFRDAITVKHDNEDSLCLQIAVQLYTYADFSKIQNPQDYAKQCILRGNEFVKAYSKFKKKGKLEIPIHLTPDVPEIPEGQE